MLYRDSSYAISDLIGAIDRGDIALPDIQRPFVWQATKVRSLFDSLYRGFPVGFLLFWETDADPGARQIGSGSAVPKLLIVDGQQRLTSLYAVMKGIEVTREDYSRSRIKIAFNPGEQQFAVADAAIERDPEYISDISVIWEPARFRSTVRAFLDRLDKKRRLDQNERDRLTDALDRVRDLEKSMFKVVELTASVDEEQVAEIFVRINSEGVTLNQADFILTLMSVFWEKGRRDLEEFCRAAKTPALDASSPFNWYLQPQPPQLLRVSVAVAFRRAVLKHVYTLLRGRDLETGKSSGEARQAQFDRLAEAQKHVLEVRNWHEFLLCLERAGFRGSKMINSENAVLFTYAMWLLGRFDYGVPVRQLRETIARWFFMASTTARYSNSVETQLERDLHVLNDLAKGDSDGFCQVLDGIVKATLTGDYWTITLPNSLATSAGKSPVLMTYIAALNILDAPVLLSQIQTRSRLDPATMQRKGIERESLFPRKHLEALGVKDTSRINQIANKVIVEWPENQGGGDPAMFWPEQVRASGLSEDELASHLRYHALPQSWHLMPYDRFLTERRRLIADVCKEAFARLWDHGYTPVYPKPEGMTVPPPIFNVTLSHLIESGLLEVGSILIDVRRGTEASAEVTSEGYLELDGEIYTSLTAAATAALSYQVNGWEFWSAVTEAGTRTLKDLRTEYHARTGQPERSV